MSRDRGKRITGRAHALRRGACAGSAGAIRARAGQARLVGLVQQQPVHVVHAKIGVRQRGLHHLLAGPRLTQQACSPSGVFAFRRLQPWGPGGVRQLHVVQASAGRVLEAPKPALRRVRRAPAQHG